MKKQISGNSEKVVYDSHARKFVRSIHQEGEFPVIGGLKGKRISNEVQYYGVAEYDGVRQFLEQQAAQLDANIVKCEEVLSELPLSNDPGLKKYYTLFAKIQKLLDVEGMREKIESDKLRQKTVMQLETFKGQRGITNGQLKGVLEVIEQAKLIDPEAFA